MKRNLHQPNSIHIAKLDLSQNCAIAYRSTEYVDFHTAYKAMNELALRIYSENAVGLLWYLEHPHTITLGSSASESDILDGEFAQIVRTDRGGKVTYHGPGQRILYIMLNLKRIHKEPDVRLFVRQLEEVVIGSLKDIGIEAFTREGRVGVWVKNGNSEAKIAAIGLKIKKWVSIHGVAININPDLNAFSNIIPCGIREYGVTSIAAMGKKISMEDFDKILHTNLIKVFKIEVNNVDNRP